MSQGRILVVEDNPKNLKLVRDVLTYAGYEVIEATSGEDGVRLAHETVPDLILMDLQLPGIDGAEALRQIRASEQAGPGGRRDGVRDEQRPRRAPSTPGSTATSRSRSACAPFPSRSVTSSSSEAPHERHRSG